MDLNKIAGTGKNSSLRFGKINHSQYHLLTFFEWRNECAVPSTTGIFGQKKDTPGNQVALLNEH